MIITDQRIVENVRVVAPRLNILQFRVARNGNLVGLDVYLSAPLAGFTVVYFGVRLNGTSIFSTYPDDYIEIPVGSSHGEITGLSIPVVKGDIISVDILGTSTQNLGAFLTFMAHIDNAMNSLEVLEYALSDETTELTTGDAKLTARVPYPFAVEEVRSSLSVESSSGEVTVDINKSGTTIFDTDELVIDADEKSSVTSSIPYQFDGDIELDDDEELTFDVVSAGTGASGLKVKLIGRKLE